MAPDLNSYDYIVVAFSGGKDSTACVLHLLQEDAGRHDLQGGIPASGPHSQGAPRCYEIPYEGPHGGHYEGHTRHGHNYPKL